jgi:hypothetical protein
MFEQIPTVIKQMIYGWLRHLLSGVGLYLLGKGLIDESQWEMILIGLTTFIVAATLSALNKFGVRDKIRVALGMARGSTGADLNEAYRISKQ